MNTQKHGVGDRVEAMLGFIDRSIKDLCEKWPIWDEDIVDGRDRNATNTLNDIYDTIEAHGFLVRENRERKRHIESLTACRDHWKASYEDLKLRSDRLVEAVNEVGGWRPDKLRQILDEFIPAQAERLSK
jgi:hypothetical protein